MIRTRRRPAPVWSPQMRVLAATLATALAVAVVIVQPLAGRRRYHRLLRALSVDPGARLRHYRRGIAGEWAAAGTVAVVGVLAGRKPASIGLGAGAGTTVGRAMPELVEVALALAVSAVVFRHGGGRVRRALRRQAGNFWALLPRTRPERWVFAGLAMTAGICEEILFRGFGIAYVRWLWPAATSASLIAVTSIAFGFAHLYQGPRGVVLTGLLGALFASVTLSTASLLPAMAMHAAVDLRILALPDIGTAGPAGDTATGSP